MNWPEKLCATRESSVEISAREILTEKTAAQKKAQTAQRRSAGTACSSALAREPLAGSIIFGRFFLREQPWLQASPPAWFHPRRNPSSPPTCSLRCDNR